MIKPHFLSNLSNTLLMIRVAVRQKKFEAWSHKFMGSKHTCMNASIQQQDFWCPWLILASSHTSVGLCSVQSEREAKEKYNYPAWRSLPTLRLNPPLLQSFLSRYHHQGLTGNPFDTRQPFLQLQLCLHTIPPELQFSIIMYNNLSILTIINSYSYLIVLSWIQIQMVTDSYMWYRAYIANQC